VTAENLEYKYQSGQTGHHHAYLLPALDRIVDEFKPDRIFDLGCGNGSVAHHLLPRCKVVGIDPSESAVRIANESYPGLRVEQGSAYDDLTAKFGTFPMVISLEVVEHLYDPHRYARSIFELLKPGSVAVVSTPYHGYLKNVALALSGKMDAHFTSLWDGGHIKFWSIRTLSALLEEAGLEVIRCERVGRIPVLAKSMIMVARRPA